MLTLIFKILTRQTQRENYKKCYHSTVAFQKRRYFGYSGGRFWGFCPTGATSCTDGSKIRLEIIDQRSTPRHISANRCKMGVWGSKTENFTHFRNIIATQWCIAWENFTKFFEFVGRFIFGQLLKFGWIWSSSFGGVIVV